MEMAKSTAPPWVVRYVNGLLRNAAREYQHLPYPDIEKDSINPTQAYQGDLFLEREYSIIHGLTFAISMESIKNFMREYKNVLEEQGYFIKLVL